MIDTLVGNASTSTSDTTANLISGLTSNLLSGLIGAVVGAVIGGAVTLWGSAIINRRERRRQLWLDLHLDLIPKALERVRQAIASGVIDDEVAGCITPVWRVAWITTAREGRRAGRATRHIAAAVTAYQRQEPEAVQAALGSAEEALVDLSLIVMARLRQ